MAELEEYLVPERLPVKPLWTEASFSALTPTQKKYVYYLARASWAGASIVMQQTSPESVDIYRLLREFFSRPHEKVSEHPGYPDLIRYTAQFLGNLGNYYGYGDQKFLPRCDRDTFRRLIITVLAPTHPKVSDWIENVVEKIYSLSEREKILGFPDHHLSAYYSEMMSAEEIERVNQFMLAQKMHLENSTVTRETDADGVYYRIHLASTTSETYPIQEYDRHRFQICTGRFSPELTQQAEFLTQAQLYAPHKLGKEMLQKYLDHLASGDVDDHVEAQRLWVQDQQPVVETNLGFIESYRDPAGVRAEYEGFVAIVDQQKSQIFSQLVTDSEHLLTKLPWPNEFHGPFLKPDFTSLEVISFCGSGIPLGINLPNYAEIRQEKGFKNVSLGNILEATFHTDPDQKISFLNDKDQALFRKHAQTAFGVQVGGHELLGHGSGKLFQEKEGTFNFDKDTVRNPMTNQKITSWYQGAETYSSVFGALSNAFEECRAECVGLLLSCEPRMLEIFRIPEDQQEEVMYTNWLLMVRSGLRSLLMFSPEEKKWRQAHSQARFVILNVLLQDAPELLHLHMKDDQLEIHLNREKILTTGREAIRYFLMHLQVYKSTADVEAGKHLFAKYGYYDATMARIREIAFQNREPRPVYIQPTLRLRQLVHDDPESVEVVMDSYPETHLGMIQSVLDKVGEL